MDGTLFDTERFHTQAFLKIGKDHQVIPPGSLASVHQLLVGKADHLVFEVVKSWQGFPQHWSAQDFVDIKTRNLLELLKEIPSRDFFHHELENLLKEAKADRHFLALVTSSEKIITSQLLALTGLDKIFDLVLTRDDCEKHKPDPWPYLKALKVSGFSPAETIIFEDSQVGIAAAIAAGTNVVQVGWHPEFDINKV